MSLTPGLRLGPYEILAAIGAGGMGEVYRARDTRLGRDVAIKVLPDAFASDPDRLARFEREARVISQLNHPGICALYDISHVPSPAAGPTKIQFLVLELVEGPTLADRIAQGPIPVDEAVGIARQICEALEAAHEIGIIHRDLKPANIKLTNEGAVKVLDFGLAKALDERSDGTPLSPSGLMSQSPTLTSPAMTRMGVILGTAVYMSPEQAKGRPADKRSDIWAFGCVLYEMLTGKRAFEGEDLTDTIAAVVRGDPDWSALPKDVPQHVRALVKGCLEKDRKVRIADVAVARFLLTQAATLAPPAAVHPGPAVVTRSRNLFWWVAAAVGLIVVPTVVILAMAGASWYATRHAVAPTPFRLNADLGADVSLTLGWPQVLSPDGSTLVFVASRALGSVPSLHVRRLDQLQAVMLAGTENAAAPFFSPDGQWIGFFADARLKKVAVKGGTPMTLCDAQNGRGGSWSEDGTIVFTPDSAPATTLHRVSSDGGKPEKLFQIADQELSQRWPQVLPGGKAVLFTSSLAAGNFDAANIVVQELPNGPRKVLLTGGYYARYLRSGHLVYLHEGTLFAAAFDLDRLEMTGSPVPAVEQVAANPNGGAAQIAISETGTVVYVPGDAVADKAPIRWLEQSGKLTDLRPTAADWSNPAFAPDGRRLAIDVHDGAQADVWVYEWQRDTLSRLTFEKADDQRPVWTPDSSRIAFASRRGDGTAFNLYWQRADGTGEVQRLTESKNSQFPTSWHPSGKFLAFFENIPGKAVDLMILPMEGDAQSGWKPGKPQIFLSGTFAESSAMFSPDGRWLAYLSNESGRTDLYVRPFPGPGGKWQISTAAADDPTWSPTSKELFYLNTADLRLMTVPYRAAGDSFQAEKPAVWSEARLSARPRPPSRDLDLHPDGKRFAVSGSDEQTSTRQDKVVFIFNFFDELRRIAPAKK